MTASQPQQEYIITEPQLAAIEIILKRVGVPMKRNVLLTEIRSRPHTPAAPAKEPLPIDGLQEFPFRLSDPKCCKDCWESEPLCHDTCGKYEMDRDAAICKAERERVLDELIEWLEPQKLPLLKQRMYRKLKSLRQEER